MSTCKLDAFARGMQLNKCVEAQIPCHALSLRLTLRIANEGGQNEIQVSQGFTYR